jgi:tetratricopeptide (TPR) repeat protein
VTVIIHLKPLRFDHQSEPITARNSSFVYKGKQVDTVTVGRVLNVRYALEGSVRKSGDKVRVTTQLIDTTSGASVWADRFDSTVHDIFDLQDQVAGSVVAAIEPRLRSWEIQLAHRKRPDSLDAYDLHLRAIAKVHSSTSDGIEEAVQLSQAALAIDPAYAPAAALAGWCRAVQKWQGWIAPAGHEYAEGVRLAKLSISSGSDDPDVLWMAGHTLAYLTKDYGAALALIGRALALNVNSAHAWGAKGLVEAYRGQSESAIDAFQRALRLNPLDPLGYHYKFGIALAHLGSNHLGEALRWVNDSLDDQPTFSAGLRVKVAVCGLMDRVDEGKASLAALLTLQPLLTVESFRFHASTFLTPEITEAMVMGFRKIGLPE